MTKTEHLLTIVSEEAGEVTQAVSKILRFGLDNHNPEKPNESNEDALLIEYYQLQAMIEHLQEQNMLKCLSDEEIHNIKSKKITKVYNIMEESKQKGTLLSDKEELLIAKANAFDKINSFYEDKSIFDDDGSDSRIFASRTCDVLCEIEDIEKQMKGDLK